MFQRQRHWGLIAVVAALAVVGAVVGGGAIIHPGPVSETTPATRATASGGSAVHIGSISTRRAAPALRVTIFTTYTSNCVERGTQCRLALLQMINLDRAAAGAGPLVLDAAMTHGTTSCLGAAGHARHMAEIGQLSHDQFPQDVCYGWSAAAENVGEAPGTKWGAILTDYQQMMAEPWTPGCQNNHHCSLMYAGYTHIGIAFVASGGVWFVSEEFAG